MIIFLGKRILVSFMTIAISMAAATAEPDLHAKSAALLDAEIASELMEITFC